ncbi:UvrD-helicase domain-containing protein [Haloechinothrix sp. LS1_15]|uniref:UvrD-helicase domain-containing protein n=1 Tax=Haloechinothrix sp. LS1_15 TaxID=2652248 RepID=UPI002944A918|nr:UvrD-helicase domain-containing protein [Haloechinothrix sp. LS1_15]MDV6012305.1 AAA family ATPase [Haloechinothrix sp. LS1_15]
MTTAVVMSDLFSKLYSKLDGSVKNRVMDFLVKLQERPDAPSLDVKTPETVKDKRVKTARVNEFWRAVLIELPESHGYVLVAVKPHDEAVPFARSLRFGVNEVTGALEVVDEAALQEAVTRVDGSTPNAAATGAVTAQPVLNGLRARDLHQFGIERDIAERLLAITDEDQLLMVAQELPGIQGNALLDLAAGRSPEDVWADWVAEEASDIDTSDVMGALERPTSRLTFTGGRGTEELRAILEEDFKAWRVWLHPLQRRLAYHDGWNGPYRVTGGAGTGKTVTAIHRARHLANRLEREGSDAKVLFTTFTRNLAQNIESQLKELAGPDILDRVEVVTVDALARKVLSTQADSERHPRMCGDEDPGLEDAWNAARRDATNDWDVSFLRSEWSQVVLAQGINDRETYLRASRSGRGRRVSRPQRADLWGVFERFTQILAGEERKTYHQAASEAAAVARNHASRRDGAGGGGVSALPNYRHAIVDEAQDLHPAHWRLVRAVVPRDTDDLFIVGDAHQRIYGNPVVLSRLGIETRGRSRRLTVNYRTSREILDWSLRVVHGKPADDLDGASDTLSGSRSEFTGPQPQARGFDTVSAEKAGLVDRLREWSAAGLGWKEIAVMARSGYQCDDFLAALSDADIPATRVEGNTEESSLGDVVRVMTMHRAKGLEYRAVAVVGAGSKELPPPGVRKLDGEEGDAAWARERSLVYVCGSRAREQLYVSWTGTPSPLLKGHA